MENYYLTIDIRENKLIELFNSLSKPINKFKIQTKSLELGDIVISKTTDNIYDKDNLILVFERKTMEDLLSSINDGRWREQKTRLLANISKEKVCYLIENQIDNRLNKWKKHGTSLVRGALINKCFRDKLNVIRTDNLFETQEFLITICKRIITNLEFFVNNEEDISKNSNYLDTIKICKKDNINKESFSILSLTIIPGVSTKIATVIINVFQSISNLVLVINDTSVDINQTIKKIADIEMNITNGKTRRIGNVIANRIVSFLQRN